MNEKILSVVRKTPFTTHYTVKCTNGSLEVRTVHRCPRCGKAHLIIWDDETSMYWTDIIFGFRKTKGIMYVQSSCRSCRCHPLPSRAKSFVDFSNTFIRYTSSKGGSNNG